MPSRFLVIGGAGYIGSHFVRESLTQGFVPVVFDNLSRGHRASVPSKVEFIEADLLDKDTLSKTLANGSFDAVFHFAAFALVGESVADPEIYYRNNVEGVKTLLDVLREMSHPPCLIFSSSCAVFGVPKKLPIAEDDEKCPMSPYGKSKLIDEWMIEDYAKAYGLKALSLRYFNACGADPKGGIGEAHEPETHLIPNILNAALRKETVTIHGDDFATDDGTCVRDYIHVNDLADAHIRAARFLEGQARGFVDAIHLGTGQGYSNLEILRVAESVLGHEISYKIGPRRAGDPAKLYADNTKAKRLLGFQTKYSELKTILATALEWHKSSADGFKP